MKRALLLAAALAVLPAAAAAQSFNVDLGHSGDAGATGRLVQITALFTVLSLAPSLLVMITAFTRIIVVLTLLRGALGAQGTPPNMVLIGLALFLTFFVMQPAMDQAWTTAIQPMTEGRMPELKPCKKPPSRSAPSCKPTPARPTCSSFSISATCPRSPTQPTSRGAP